MFSKAFILIVFLSFVVNANELLHQRGSGDKSQDKTAEQIDRLLSKFFSENEPGGTVIAVKEGNIIFRKAYGIADRESNLKIDPAMVFAIGSVTKTFTSVATLMLVDQGKISLDDDITTYLNDYPKTAYNVKIKHLLSHTSGIKDIFSIQGYSQDLAKDVSVDELISYFKNEPLNFTPGDKYEYSNSGYILLGRIIESVTGRSYEELINEYIFSSLKMNSTFFLKKDIRIRGMVKGYQKEKGIIQDAPFFSVTHLYSAGSIATTVDDLTKFNEALYSGKLLKKETLMRSISPFKLNDGKDSRCGLGWFIGELKGKMMVYHGGGIHGFVVHTLYLPEEKIYVALLRNCVDERASPSTPDIAMMVASVIIGDYVPLEDKIAISLSEADLKKYSGNYKFVDDKGNLMRREVLCEDGKLFYVTGGKRTELLPESKTKFFVKGAQSYFSFELDENENIKKMIIHLGGVRELVGIKE